MPDPSAIPPPIAPSALPRDRRGALAWLRLARSLNVGPRSFIGLLGKYGSAERALAVLAEGGETGRRPMRAGDAGVSEAERDAAEAAGARMLCLGAPDYPAALALIADPPPVLWALGDVTVLARPSVALVGARNASALGLRMAASLAAGLGAAGHAVASGLARGIDTAAHEAALPTGTVAVLPGGIDQVYPEENAGLARRIAETGVLVSEAPMGTRPGARHFPRRNRIISGLSRAVVLVEAAERSGTLLTARAALDQGREVMAVPGTPLDPRAAGCNAMIRDGAVLVRDAGDVLEALDYPVNPGRPATLRYWERPVPVPEPVAPPLLPVAPPELAERILTLLPAVPMPLDELLRRAGAPQAQVMEVLLDLALEGVVERRADGTVLRRG